jgi:hypothetical protein
MQTGFSIVKKTKRQYQLKEATAIAKHPTAVAPATVCG